MLIFGNNISVSGGTGTSSVKVTGEVMLVNVPLREATSKIAPKVDSEAIFLNEARLTRNVQYIKDLVDLKKFKFNFEVLDSDIITIDYEVE